MKVRYVWSPRYDTQLDRLRRGLVVALVIAAVLGTSRVVPALPSDAAESVVTIDLANSHKFSGIGFEIWSLPQTPPALIDLLRDLVVTQVRMGSFPEPQAAVLTRGTTRFAKMLVIDDAATPHQIQRWQWLAQQLKTLRIGVHLVIWQEPRPWRITKRWFDRQGHPQLSYLADASDIESFADYICWQLRYGRSLGFPITEVELTNEPDGNWDTQWSPGDYAHLVVVARRRMNEAGLAHIGIEGPGTGTEQAAAPYLVSLRMSGASADLAAVSVHDYDTRFTPDPVGLTPQFQEMAKAVSGGLPIHVTEFNDQTKRWQASPSVGTSMGRFATESRPFGLALAREAMKTVEDGATESLIWQAEDMAWDPSHFGVIDEHGHSWPSADALKAFLPAVNRASCVAPGVSSDGGLQAAAFLTKYKIAIVVMNAGTGSRTVLLRLSHEDAPLGKMLSVSCYSVDLNAGSSGCPRLVTAGPNAARVVMPIETISTTVFERMR